MGVALGKEEPMTCLSGSGSGIFFRQDWTIDPFQNYALSADNALLCVLHYFTIEKQSSSVSLLTFQGFNCCQHFIAWDEMVI